MASELPCYTLLSANPDKGGDLSEQGLKKVGQNFFNFLTGFDSLLLATLQVA